MLETSTWFKETFHTNGWSQRWVDVRRSFLRHLYKRGVSAQTVRRLDRNFNWIAGIFAGIIIALITVLLVIAWLQPTVGTPPELPASTILATPYKTAQIGYALAQQEAIAWQEDAQLLAAVTTWENSNDIQQLQSGKAVWGYTFYSPTDQSVTIVSVTDSVTISQAKPSNKTFTPIGVGGWQLDSAEILNMLFQRGAETFITRNGNVSLTLSLTTDNDEGKLIWFASLIAPKNGETMLLQVDATNGEILSFQQIP
jgi:hypothetical protein